MEDRMLGQDAWMVRCLDAWLKQNCEAEIPVQTCSDTRLPICGVY